jgi:hypothetical protein
MIDFTKLNKSYGWGDMSSPRQWKQAGDIYKGLSQAGYTTPQSWTDADAQLKKLWGEKGSQVDVQGMFKSLLPAAESAYRRQAQRLSTQWGAANPGVSGSSGLDATKSQAWADMIAQLGSQALQQGQQSAEAATQRRYQLPSIANQLGASRASQEANWQGLLENLAQGEQSLGTSRANLPLQVSQAAQQYEISPWEQLASSLVGTPSMTPTTYTPGTIQRLLGVAQNIDWTKLLGGGGGGGPMSSFVNSNVSGLLG